MTLRIVDLRQRFSDGGTVSVLGSEFPDRLAAIISRVVGRDTLDIVDSVLERESKEVCEVVGTIPAFMNVLDCKVKVSFFEVENELQCAIATQMPNTWRVSDSFLNLPAHWNFGSENETPLREPSFFTKLRVQDVSLIFSSSALASTDFLPSNPGVKISKGLSFFGTMSLDGPFGQIAQIAGIKNSVSFEAFCEFDSIRDAVLTLRAKLDMELKVGSLGITFAESEIYSSISDKATNQTSGLRLFGKLQFGSHVLKVSGEYLIGGDSMTVSFQDVPVIPRLSELVAIIGGNDLAQELPASLDDLGQISLEEFSVTFSPSDRHVSLVELSVGTTGTWNIAPRFSVTSLSVTWYVASPFDDRRFSVKGIGILKIGDISLAISARYPDFQMAGSLLPGQEIKLSTVFDELGISCEPMEDLAIVELELFGQPKLGFFRFSISVAKVWSFKIGEADFAIESIRLDAQYQANSDSSDRKATGSLVGFLDLGGAHAVVRADLNENLTLSAHIDELNLNQLIDKMLGNGSLPDFLPELILSEIDASITPSTSAFSFSGNARIATGEKFSLIGLNLDLPDSATFALSLAREAKKADGTAGKTKLSLKAKMKKDDFLAVSTSLGWNREMDGKEMREIQNDENASPEDPIRVEVRANQDVEITLVETTFGDASQKGTYFAGFKPDQWTITFGFLGLSYSFEPGKTPIALKNPAGDKPKEFTLPFLKQKAPASPEVKSDTSAASPQVANKSAGDVTSGSTPHVQAIADTTKPETKGKGPLDKLGQYIRIRPPTADNIKIDGSLISIAVPATICIGSLEFDTDLPLGFDLSTMAFKVSHPDGIKVMLPSMADLAAKKKPPSNTPKQMFGLAWTFLGAPVDDAGKPLSGVDPRKHEGRSHLFTLVTKDYNYQLQQAPGSVIEIAYTKASKEPIAFAVRDFAVSSKGLSISAEVLDNPVTLNGVNTKFKFAGSKLVIVENKVKDLTLSGSGPLPPKLVGEAMVDISIQFQERNGDFTLVAGEAKLKGNKLLSCEGTRFQFQLDGVGLKFVNDGGFHLYFTLTGKARMVLGKKDSKSGALAMLPSIELELNECPLTGDVTVLAKHISFLVELPKPISFPFLGAYEYELRAIGFNPKFEKFGGDPAMMLSGQIKFAQGKGDSSDKKPDLHKLFIGLPEAGKIIPRIYMDKLPLAINLGDAFKLNGVVEFLDGEMLQGFKVDGFSGEGVLEIKGLPPIAASFGFFRVLRSDGVWVRAWFIYVEVRQISLLVPYVQFYLREVGLGFGYRYTLAGIKAADKAGDLKQMIAELKKLSRTQGDLAKRDRWAIDMEEPGENPRWTIVMRAMFSQSSAATTPLTWKQEQEENLPCAYLFDVVASFRSDLTFFMTARAWINTSYGYYVKEQKAGNSLEPLLSGFILLSVRQKRLLAHMASNPNGFTGSKPVLPEFAKTAIKNSQFSATLLLEPGLAHFELGWPNMLRWGMEVGPIKVERRGGFIFRITEDYLLIGISYQERGTLRIEAGVDLGIAGASLKASADLALSARLMALIDFNDTGKPNPNVYGAIGLDIQVKVEIELWLELLLFRIDFSFSFEIGFSAALEIGIHGLEGPQSVGIRGQGTISVKLMGHRLSFSVNVVHNGAAVDAARLATEKYMNLGLEAEDVDKSLPGIDTNSGKTTVSAAIPQKNVSAPATLVGAVPTINETTLVAPASASGNAAAIASEPESQPDQSSTDSHAMTAAAIEHPKFSVPDYSLFVIRSDDKKSQNAFSYFVLVPAASDRNGTLQRGFLPVPPEHGSTTDFTWTSPSLDGSILEHFDPKSNQWNPVSENADYSWSANWGQRVVDYARANDKENVKDATLGLTLAQYLTQAFVTNGEKEMEKVLPLSDPDPVLDADHETLEDGRGQNPSDSAYEAAVRGTFEQFRGSPFFKHDPTLRYDRLLQSAFKDGTTPFAKNDATKAAPSNESVNQQTRAHQVRSLIVESLVSDLQSYAEQVDEIKSTWEQNQGKKSIAFQMGLVFRIRANEMGSDWKLPLWLNEISTEDSPKIRQRALPDQSSPSAVVAHVQTFNVVGRDFAINPPRFQQVRHYTDAGTIAITWKLDWAPEQNGSSAQTAHDDPEHHLKHYLVRRRDMEGRAPEVTYTAKNADVMHREPNDQKSVLQFLRPRFQIVDNFGSETAQDLADLPATGRSYLYTITPIDLAGHAGFPLTLVATRYPNEPPKVPLDGKICVDYLLSESGILPEAKDSLNSAPKPRLLSPHIRVTWTEPSIEQDGRPFVAVEHYYLVFRRQRTVPIGSYGLDSETQRAASDLLPTTNARILPTDIKLKINRTREKGGVFADVRREALEERGVFPSDRQWRPESWRVFLQTEAVNGVPSALAPVQCVIRVRTNAGQQFEERTPAEIEWLPRPIVLEMLPPEDQQAITGMAHVPMPVEGQFQFKGTIENVDFRPHPFGVRCIRMNWNQGPSHLREYPLELTAGYDLLELDVDAHTRNTFQDKDRLASVLREIQEVQMLPADQLALTPGDTLTTNQWEAWYPSAVARIIKPENRAEGSEAVLGPWYSWRESLLLWPEWWSKETKQPVDLSSPRDSAFHPFLDAIVKQLKGGQDPTQGYLVHVQPLPAIQPGDFKAFVKSTDPNSDPYGWGVLQRFGLSITISLRDVQSGELILGERMLGSVNKAIQDSMDELTLDDKTKEQAQKIGDHLFVELLFQPGRSIHLEVADTNPSALLGILQISLRPIAKQQLQYGQLELSGPAGSEVTIVFKDATWPCSVINQSDLDRGQMEIVERPTSIPSTGAPATMPDSKPPALTLKLPMHGTTKLYLRAEKLPNITVTSKSSTQGQSLELKPASGFEALGAGDSVSTYFTRSIDSLADLFFEDETAVREWNRFCWYAQSLNSTDPAVPESAKISLPNVPKGKSAISPEQANELKSKLAKEILPEFLDWSKRFFEASAVLTSETEPHGPWVASAYARVESPAHAAPDKAGRLTYHHLLQDRWAHNYRYYVRPIDRYSYLWQGLLESPVLFPSGTPESKMARRRAQEMKSVVPDPLAGGLDVVLDRTYPIDMPLVLSSKRLDLTGLPGQPELPGQTWEVIVSQHREQALMERNQTVARRLGYRHISFALQRRFIYEDWVQVLTEVLKTRYHHPHEIDLQIPSDHYPEIPLRYPDTPDHLAIAIDGTAGSTLLLAESKSLDLPNRIERFQQGAIVLQWDGLPFFYEHQLLLIAQSSTTVSPINRVVQRDFEYRSPEPVAKMRCEPNASTPERGSDRNELHMLLPLRPFWDSLPSRAQDHWKAEEPAPNDFGRKPASLPDREVVYQLVAIYSGNIEVQAEFLFDEETEDYVVRQLGRSYQATIADFIPAIGANDLYALNILLEEQTEFPVQLTEAFGRAGLIQSQPETKPDDSADEKSLRFKGVFARQDRNKLLIHLTPELSRLADDPGPDQALVEAFLEKWFATRTIGATPNLTAIALNEKVSYVPVVEWNGRIDDVQKSTFAAWIDEADSVTRVTLEKILGKLKLQDATDSIGAIAEIGLLRSEPRLPSKATLAHDLPKLSWTGSVTSKDADELRTVFFKTAVERLIAEAAKQTIEVPYDPRLAGISQAELDTALGSDVGRLKLPELPANDETPVPNVRWRGIYELECALEKLTKLKPELADWIDNIRKQAESKKISIEYRSSSDIPTVLKPSFEFQKSLMRISSPLTDDEVARLKSLFSGSDLDVIDQLLADLRDRMAIDRVYESWLYEEPVSSVNAFASPNNAQVKAMDGYFLEWNGSFDEKDKIELEQLQGDEWFQSAIKRMVGSLKGTTDVVRQRVRVVVPSGAQYELPAKLPSKLLVLTANLSHHGHMSETEASSIRATCRNESDQDAVTRLYEKSNVGRRGVELFVMSRRGSAPPSKMIPVTV